MTDSANLKTNSPSRAAFPVVATVAALLVAAPVSGVDGAPDGAAGHSPCARSFEFRYEVLVRGISASAREAHLWLPRPPETREQEIRNLTVDTSLPYQVVTEERYGNRAFRFDLPVGVAEARVRMTFEVLRRERVRRPDASSRGAARPRQEELARWLGPDNRVPIDGKIREWAVETVAGRTTDLAKARAIYDYVVTNLEYDKTGTGWGNGDIYWACDAKRGNCTDFHALFIGFTRAVGIPAKFEMGFPIPAARGAGEIGGYHCWVQFFLEGHGWIPVDASEANKNPDKRAYFFGAHDANRVLFTVGRDLTFPGMRGAPLNFFIYPYAEVDGVPHAAVERRFHYRDLSAPVAPAR